MPNIAPAYQASKGSALAVDKALYRRIAQELGSRRLIEQLVVPIRSGRAWRVPAGHVFRIVTIDGPQVGDLNIWNWHNPRERMWASRPATPGVRHFGMSGRRFVGADVGAGCT